MKTAFYTLAPIMTLATIFVIIYLTIYSEPIPDKPAPYIPEPYTQEYSNEGKG